MTKTIKCALELAAPNVIELTIDANEFQTEDTVLTRYLGIKETVVIPDGITEISDDAFNCCHNLKNITIPDSVTKIGEGAFSVCIGLMNITIPKNVTGIGDGAFCDCRELASITIPSRVTKIGRSVFEYCNNLVSIKVSGDNKVYHDKNNCLIETKSKTLIAGCKNSVIPNDGSVTKIGNDAFSGCEELKSIIIPDGVTEIEDCAFFDCAGLTSVTIPDSVTDIGYKAFCGCHSLTSVNIPNGVTKIGSSAFCYCENIKEISIPDSVTEIGNGAFDLNGLSKIKVSGGNKTYHDEGNCLIETKSKTLISGCRNSVIPNDGSVTVIGNDAFYDCSGLTDITIPDSVTEIGNDAFGECVGLKEITIPAGVTEIGYDALSGCKELSIIKVSDANKVYSGKGNCLIETKSRTLIAGCKNSIIPDDGSVTKIGRSAFYCCTELTEINIPNTVTEIEDWAFSECTELTDINIPNGLIKIGSNAFIGCEKLTNVNFNGTKERWHLIEKHNDWDYIAYEYTVHCIDGDIKCCNNGAIKK